MDIEFKWAENAKLARELVSLQNKSQMKIAGLALEVCEITRGGCKNRDKYTLTRFAEEIGINYRLLSAWVCVRKNVYDKISDEQKMHQKLNYTKLAQTALRVKSDTPANVVEDKLDVFLRGGGVQTAVLDYVKTLRSIAYNFEQKEAATKCTDDLLQEVLFFCRVITRNIAKNRPDIKPQDNNLAASTNIKYLSVARAIGEEMAGKKTTAIFHNKTRVLITEKDKKIIHFMRKNKGYVSPTEIGRKVGEFHNKSATAWACRTLNKLVNIDRVERNKNGHYKWLE